MAIKLITLRSFMTEISSSIVSANERLLSGAPDDTSGTVPADASTRAAPLEIKNVRVSFSAHVVNRKLLNTKQVRQDEILLDFTTEGKRPSCNMYGEMVFSGKGEPVEPEEWPDDEENPSGDREEFGGGAGGFGRAGAAQGTAPGGGEYESFMPQA